jgi:hypothetical protein
MFMRDIWILNGNRNPDTIICFLYDKEEGYEVGITKIYNNIYDVNLNTDNTLDRTLIFLKFLQTNNYFDMDYIVRSNASALINIPMFLNFLEPMPRDNFVGGCLIGEFSNKILNGGICTYTKDSVDYLLSNIDQLSNLSANEDVVTSFFLMRKPGIRIVNIPRLDFIDNKNYILIHGCKIEYVSNIFYYRFKTSDRYDDVLNMLKYFFNWRLINDEDYEIQSIGEDFQELYGKLFTIEDNDVINYVHKTPSSPESDLLLEECSKDDIQI